MHSQVLRLPRLPRVSAPLNQKPGGISDPSRRLVIKQPAIDTIDIPSARDFICSALCLFVLCRCEWLLLLQN
jgi:hypothetical protein